MARRPALTLLHLGPGLANATANLHNARRAGTPLVNLVGGWMGGTVVRGGGGQVLSTLSSVEHVEQCWLGC